MPTSADRLFYLVSSLAYLLLLWFVSGLARTGAGLLFAAGASALAGCLVLARSGRRRPLFALQVGLLLTAAAVGGVESALRLAPGLVHGQAANAAFSAYHCGPGGIYEKDAHLGHALRPGAACDTYWNGHWWRHECNHAGYRGPDVGRADVVFLGDSMVYGHGVAQEHTVPARFTARTGLAAANLGQQGTCLVQMWLR